MARRIQTEPPPEHLISPLVGRTGFRYLPGLDYALAPPDDWEDQCIRAEEQTDHLQPDQDWMPVSDLYTDNRSINPRMGWLVDA